MKTDWWQDQKIKLDKGNFVDRGALSHDFTIREKVPMTSPNIQLGEIYGIWTKTWAQEVRWKCWNCLGIMLMKASESSDMWEC